MRHASLYRVILLSLLLVVMQQAAEWHALDHIGQALQRSHEHALYVPQQDGPCAVCALFAGGASAAPNDSTAPPVALAALAAAAPDVVSPTAPAPSSYLIRAPPALL